MHGPGRVDVGGSVTARNIIIATGSVPFVPPGIPIDGKTVRACSCRSERSNNLLSVDISWPQEPQSASGVFKVTRVARELPFRFTDLTVQSSKLQICATALLKCSCFREALGSVSLVLLAS